MSVRTHVFDTGNSFEQVLVTVYPDGKATVAFRDAPRYSWGPPIFANVCACNSCSPQEVDA